MRLTQDQIDRIVALESAAGVVTPAAVVADAAAPDSPLYGLFQWDDSKAAAAYRLDQARTVIRTVTIHRVTHNVEYRRVPYYVHTPDAGTAQGYTSMVAVRRDPVMARETVLAELGRAAGNLTRAREIARALDLAEEFDQLLDQVLGLRRRVESLEAPAESPGVM